MPYHRCSSCDSDSALVSTSNMDLSEHIVDAAAQRIIDTESFTSEIIGAIVENCANQILSNNGWGPSHDEYNDLQVEIIRKIVESATQKIISTFGDNDFADEILAQFRAEFSAQRKAEFMADLRSTVIAEITDGLKDQLKADIVAAIMAQYNAERKVKLKEELKAELKAELWAEFQNDMMLRRFEYPGRPANHYGRDQQTGHRSFNQNRGRGGGSRGRSRGRGRGWVNNS